MELVVIIALTLGAGAGDSPNPLLRALTDEGLPAGKDVRVRLPAPSLPDGLNAAEQQAALEGIADANHPLAALLRKSVVAPFVLHISDDKTAANYRRVDLWFVVYADLDHIADEEFLQGLADPKGEPRQAGQGEFLTAEALDARDIQRELPPDQERYFALSGELFERVEVQATSRTVRTNSAESVIVASQVDPRFAADAEFPNRWRRLQRDEAGKRTARPWQEYSGAAWYVKATRLKSHDGALLVELHLAFDEPRGWFDGANLLRSKLPLVVQDAVRKFRRKSAK